MHPNHPLRFRALTPPRGRGRLAVVGRWVESCAATPVSLYPSHRPPLYQSPRLSRPSLPGASLSHHHGSLGPSLYPRDSSPVPYPPHALTLNRSRPCRLHLSPLLPPASGLNRARHTTTTPGVAGRKEPRRREPAPGGRLSPEDVPGRSRLCRRRHTETPGPLPPAPQSQHRAPARIMHESGVAEIADRRARPARTPGSRLAQPTKSASQAATELSGGGGAGAYALT